MKQILTKYKAWVTPLAMLFVFVVSVQAAHALSPIRINELHYNPSGNQGAGNDKEFIELYNGSDTTVSLAGWSFYGVNYVFPGGAALGPGRYLVLAKNPAQVPAAVYGQYTGNLEDEGGGETIQLRNAGGSVMSQVSYSYLPPWPAGAKNTGYSLSLIRTSANEQSPYCWEPSAGIGGTPGYGNSVQGGGDGCGDVAFPVSAPPPSSGGSSAGAVSTQPQTDAENQAAEEQEKVEEQKKAEEKKQKAEAKKASQKAKEEQATRENTMRVGHALAAAALVALPALTFAGVMAYRRLHHGKAFKDLLKSDSVKLPKKGKK